MMIVAANNPFISYPNRVIKVWFPAVVQAVGDCEMGCVFVSPIITLQRYNSIWIFCKRFIHPVLKRNANPYQDCIWGWKNIFWASSGFGCPPLTTIGVWADFARWRSPRNSCASGHWCTVPGAYCPCCQASPYVHPKNRCFFCCAGSH